MLSSINCLCTVYAAEMGVKPEQVELEIGKQFYRFVKFFNIAPQKPLQADALDFDSEIISPIIVQGYRDARAVIQHFLEYEFRVPRALRGTSSVWPWSVRKEIFTLPDGKIRPQKLYHGSTQMTLI